MATTQIWRALTGPFTCTGCTRNMILDNDASQSDDGLYQLCRTCNRARVLALWADRDAQPPRPGRWHVTARLLGEPRLDRHTPYIYGDEDYGVPRTSHTTRQGAFAAAVLAARTANAVSVTDPAGETVLTWSRGYPDVWATWGLVCDATTRYYQLAAARWAADLLSPQPV